VPCARRAPRRGYNRPIAELLNETADRHLVCEHLVQVYRDTGELSESVATYLTAGFEAGEPAIAVVTAAHWSAIRERLRRGGWSTDELEVDGQLVVADAELTLAAILEAGEPSFRRFTDVVGGLIDRAAAAAPGRPIRVFGEMVDLLCRRGDESAADALEGLWNRLGARRSFSLLCAYELDVFDRRAQVTLLPQVCRSHSRLLPAVDAERLERAVDAALHQTLGPIAARKVYAQVERQGRDRRVPPAELALMWLSAHMPQAAERILSAARKQYLS
jgi:MEDS: MEthanogen/methylotroph, DcmR Sensory domain